MSAGPTDNSSEHLADPHYNNQRYADGARESSAFPGALWYAQSNTT
jgi:hypothetical protein